MNFKRECPYCHSIVKENITPISHEHRMYEYTFSCDCTEVTMYDEEKIVYMQYLFQREKNNLINFDCYFGDSSRTVHEFDAYIDEWCAAHEDLDCKQCPFGQVGWQIANHEGEPWGTCFELMQWLEKKTED